MLHTITSFIALGRNLLKYIEIHLRTANFYFERSTSSEVMVKKRSVYVDIVNRLSISEVKYAGCDLW